MVYYMVDDIELTVNRAGERWPPYTTTMSTVAEFIKRRESIRIPCIYTIMYAVLWQNSQNIPEGKAGWYYHPNHHIYCGRFHKT
jgi:hypothetical protein